MLTSRLTGQTGAVTSQSVPVSNVKHAEVENSADCANLCDSHRIVVHGKRFARAVVTSSAKPFNFQEEYLLTEDQVTRRVSGRSGVACFSTWTPEGSQVQSNGEAAVCLSVSLLLCVQALDVSDHYPVEVLLRSAANKVSWIQSVLKYVLISAFFPQVFGFS